MRVWAGWGDVTLEPYSPDYSRESPDTYTRVKQEIKTLRPGASALFDGHSLVGGQLHDRYWGIRQFRIDVNGSGVWARNLGKIGGTEMVQAGFQFGPAELANLTKRGDITLRLVPGTNRAIRVMHRDDTDNFTVLGVDLVAIDIEGTAGGTKDKKGKDDKQDKDDNNKRQRKRWGGGGLSNIDRRKRPVDRLLD